ncbi:hypothetical protein H0H92_001092, partial [Tricholoma furcatifolium]
MDQLDNELVSMALIRSLPEEYSSFVSSLLLLESLDKATIHQAFVREDTQRSRRSQDAANHALAMNATVAQLICDLGDLPHNPTQEL